MLFESWAKQYGNVFQIPGPLGQRRTVLVDPKAVAHYFGKSAQIYVKSNFGRQIIADVVRPTVVKLVTRVLTLAPRSARKGGAMGRRRGSQEVTYEAKFDGCYVI